MVNNNEYNNAINEITTNYLFSKYHILLQYSYTYTWLNLSPSKESLLLHDNNNDDNNDADDDKFDKSFFQCNITKKYYTK